MFLTMFLLRSGPLKSNKSISRRNSVNTFEIFNGSTGYAAPADLPDAFAYGSQKVVVLQSQSGFGEFRCFAEDAWPIALFREYLA